MGADGYPSDEISGPRLCFDTPPCWDNLKATALRLDNDMSDSTFSCDQQTSRQSAELHQHDPEPADLLPCRVIQSRRKCHNDQNGLRSLHSAKASQR